MRSPFGGRAEFFRRVAFTLGALAIYRLGSYIPIPGIDGQFLAEIFDAQPNGFFGVMGASAIRAFGQMSVFALGIGPYLTASFVILVLTFFSVRLRRLVSPERQMRVTRCLALVLAALQACAVARGLEVGGRGWHFGSLVTEPDALFRLSTVVTLTAGTVFLIWLAEQITKRGIGNGISLMLFSAIVIRIPESFYRLFKDDWAAFLPTDAVRTVLIVFVGLVVFIILIESARIRIPVLYGIPQGPGTPIDATSSLTFKLNNAGIVPIYFSGQILLLPATIRDDYVLQDGFIATVASALQWGSWSRVAAGAVVIAILCFVYVALVLSPKKMAQDLERHRGVIPGVAPGQPTADYLDRVLTWTTVIGALYLWAVSMLPSYVAELYRVPVMFSLTNLLVVVAVALDAIQQARALWPAAAPAKPVEDGIGDCAPGAR